MWFLQKKSTNLPSFTANILPEIAVNGSVIQQHLLINCCFFFHKSKVFNQCQPNCFLMSWSEHSEISNCMKFSAYLWFYYASAYVKHCVHTLSNWHGVWPKLLIIPSSAFLCTGSVTASRSTAPKRGIFDLYFLYRRKFLLVSITSGFCTEII